MYRCRQLDLGFHTVSEQLPLNILHDDRAQSLPFLPTQCSAGQLHSAVTSLQASDDSGQRRLSGTIDTADGAHPPGREGNAIDFEDRSAAEATANPLKDQ